MDPLPATPVRPPPPELLAPGVLVPAFILLIVVGYALFTHGVGTVAGNELSKHQAVMVAVNAATLTGFQQARNPADYTLAGQVLTLALMVAGSLFSLVGGGLAVVRIARLPYRDQTVALAAAAAVVGALLIGVIAGAGPGRTRFDGAYQAVSAFGNCGLYTGRLPAGGDGRTLWLLLPLAVAGSLGLPVLLDLGHGRWSSHTRRALTASAGAYLLTVLALVPVMAWKGSIAATGTALPNTFAVASLEAVNARSAGFPFEFVTELPAAAAVVLMVAMAVGGAPGGTAGGVKVTAVAAVAIGVRDALLGRPVRRAFGVAVGWVVVYAGLLVAVTVAVVLAEPELPGDRALFLAVSALGNVGLSHDPVSPSIPGRYVLSIAMLLGRVLPVLVLWTVADRMPDVDEAIG